MWLLHYDGIAVVANLRLVLLFFPFLLLAMLMLVHSSVAAANTVKIGITVSWVVSSLLLCSQLTRKMLDGSQLACWATSRTCLTTSTQLLSIWLIKGEGCYWHSQMFDCSHFTHMCDSYTCPGKICADGASNGGLLVCAAINQRPDLYCFGYCLFCFYYLFLLLNQVRRWPCGCWRVGHAPIPQVHHWQAVDVGLRKPRQEGVIKISLSLTS